MRLYETVRDLPIVDYHCHLNPREIYEDRPFGSITEIWLKYDHYKWRLMRQCMIDERFITGSAPEREKFRAYLKALELSPGNPLYDWSRMELEMVFHTDLPLTEANADKIFDRANETIVRENLSPRKLIRAFRVESLCTTDDPVDDLEYHEKLALEKYETAVLPSFRVDKILRISEPGFREYVSLLLQKADVKDDSIRGVKEALRKRFLFFVDHGCRVADMGIPEFPSVVGTEKEADQALKKALKKEALSAAEAETYVGHLLSFFAGLYKENGVVSQYHLAVLRNPNSLIYEAVGADAGCDSVADPIPATKLVRILDMIQTENGGLPRTILYTLNQADTAKMITISGAFRNVTVGAAWWFVDHYRGIYEQLEKLSELSSIGQFPGMLTDSRSFLSYTRHDFYRRILCSFLGEFVESGRAPYETAEKIAKRLSYDNARSMISGGNVNE